MVMDEVLVPPRLNSRRAPERREDGEPRPPGEEDSDEPDDGCPQPRVLPRGPVLAAVLVPAVGAAGPQGRDSVLSPGHSSPSWPMLIPGRIHESIPWPVPRN